MKLGYKVILYLIVLNMLTPEIAQACKPQISWGSSVSFCQGNSFTLNAANPNSTYTWSTGATTSSISVSTSGIYWVSVTNPCGTTSDTIQVIVDNPVSVNLGKDRSICSGSTTTLSVPFSPNSSYLWQNGYTGHQINVSQPGTYHVAVTNACGTYRDTIHISVDSPQAFTLGPDVVNCTSNPTMFSLPAGISGAIQWSNGSKGTSLSVNQSGTYWVKVTNACGVVSDTVKVAFVGPGNLFSSDTVLFCNAGSLTLSSPVNTGSHLWSTSSTAQSIQVTQPGTYWLTVSLPCGTFSDTVHLIGSSTNVVNLGPDKSICLGDSVTLDAGNAGSSFIWNGGHTSQKITTDTTGTFWVGANNGCGWVYDTIIVSRNVIPAPAIDDTVYVCQGNPAALDAGSWGAQSSYLWSNSITTQQNTSLGLGPQWVKVMNSCDTVTKHFYVKSTQPVTVNLGNDTIFCGNSLVLKSHISPHGNTFLWSKGGNTTENLTVTTTGTYWLQVTNACGVFSDTVVVQILKKPAAIPQDTIAKCVGGGVWIKTALRPNTTYQWNTGGNIEKIYVTNPGKYWLTAYNQCDTISDTAYVVNRSLVNFSLGKDTTFCSPAKLVIPLLGSGIDSVIWKDGVNRNSVTIRNTGKYWAIAYTPCGNFTDTINVVVNKPAVKMLRDTSFCLVSPVTLDVTQSQATSYLWNTNATTPSIQVNSVGWYYVDITTLCGTTRDSAYVNVVSPLPAINLGNDTLFCAGQLLLDPGYFPNARYRWSTGDTTQTFTVTSSGTYYVEIFNTCNTVTDTIDVQITGAPKMALGNNVKFCGGSTLNLNAQNPGCTYQWNTGQTTQTLNVTAGGKYWVTITNLCGSITDSINVIVEVPLNNVSLGTDTSICRGDSILLETQIPGVHTKWKNGSNMPSIYVKETGDYWVQVFNSCGSWEDTVHVEVIDQPQFSLGADTAICAIGGSLLLTAPADMESYIWNDGSSGTSLLATEAGKYWLTVTNKCFSYSDTIEIIEEHPVEIDLGPDTVLCYGESLELNANLGNTKYKWSDNSNIPTKTVTESGTYWLSTSNSCGVFGDTITVQFDKPLDLQRVDTTICDSDTAIFDLSDVNEDFTWFDGSTQKVRKFVKEGDYAVTLKNKCGEFTRIYSVNVSYCECPFFVPNAFSPNGDGTNDEFKVGHSCDLSQYTIQVFNRWGQMVYESHNSDEGWDGTYGGTEAPGGVYTYRISYLWYVYGVDRVREHTGTITIMR